MFPLLDDHDRAWSDQQVAAAPPLTQAQVDLISRVLGREAREARETAKRNTA
jgi:hypothetical protein